MFSDALDREAAWLNSSGDGLPALNTSAGGPFQIVQARWPRVPAARKTALYVLRSPSGSFQMTRFAAIRSIGKTSFMLRLLWPLSTGTGSAEVEQDNFEQAIDQVILRISGPIGDKTHGGRFLSVAEDHQEITVHMDDPEQSLMGGIFRATVTYGADDPEINN